MNSFRLFLISIYYFNLFTNNISLGQYHKWLSFKFIRILCTSYTYKKSFKDAVYARHTESPFIHNHETFLSVWLSLSVLHAFSSADGIKDTECGWISENQKSYVAGYLESHADLKSVHLNANCLSLFHSLSNVSHGPGKRDATKWSLERFRGLKGYLATSSSGNAPRRWVQMNRANKRRLEPPWSG
jgi:hypothetical protein